MSGEDEQPAPEGAILYVSCLSTLAIISVLSNFLVIYVMLSCKKMHSVTNVFICNLAIADILIAGIVVPQNVHHALHTAHFVEGIFGCRSTTFLPIFCSANSLYNMVAAAYDRHRAIVSFTDTKLTLNKAFVATFVIWVLSLVVAAPTLAEYSMVEEEEAIDAFVTESYRALDNVTSTGLSDEHHEEAHGGAHCSNKNQTWEYILANTFFVMAVVFVLPFVLIVFLYGRVGFFIWRKGRGLGKDNSVSPEQLHGTNSMVSRKVVRIVRMLITSVIFFVVFRTPVFIISTFMKLTGQTGSENAFTVPTILLNLFLTLGTSYNIIVYMIFNHAFRNKMRKRLCGCCPAKVTAQEDSSMTNTSHVGNTTGCSEG